MLLAQLALLPSAPATAAADFELDDYAGKVVILDFWASWCVPCRRSFPWLNAMHAKHAIDGLVIIGANLDLERAEAERFLHEFPPDFKIVYDDDQALAKQFEVMAMPSSYLIGRDGEVIARHLGFKVKKQAEYEAAIVRALGNTESDDE
jgi:thiol-disulfide isomerase/thioredoxin